MTRSRQGRAATPCRGLTHVSSHRKGTAMTTTAAFDEEAIPLKARELHGATDGTGCDCCGTYPGGSPHFRPRCRRGWCGLATAAIIEKDRLAQVESGASTDDSHRECRQAEGGVAGPLRGSASTEHQANTVRTGPRGGSQVTLRRWSQRRSV